MVWYMELSPRGSGVLGLPRKADLVPLCACRLETTGVGLVAPGVMTHGGKLPVSKLPLKRTQGPGVKGILSKNTSCCAEALIATRPSVQA